jgi:hypothetical protein
VFFLVIKIEKPTGSPRMPTPLSDSYNRLHTLSRGHLSNLTQGRDRIYC